MESLNGTVVSPESMGVGSQGILEWVKALEEAKLETHGLVMLRHGRKIAEGWWNPYTAETPAYPAFPFEKLHVHGGWFRRFGRPAFR